MTISCRLVGRGRKLAFSRMNKIHTSFTCQNLSERLVGNEEQIMLLRQTQATVEVSKDSMGKQITRLGGVRLSPSWATLIARVL